MSLYGDIEYDGRVQRSIDALKVNHRIYLFTYCHNPEYYISDVTILRHNQNLLSRSNVLRFFSYLHGFLKINKYLKPRVVYLHDYYFSFLGLLFKVMGCFISIYDAHEIIIPMKAQKVGVRQRFFQFLESSSIKSFDVIVTANEQRAKIMAEYYNLRVKPTAINNIPLIREEKLLDLSEISPKYPELKKVFDSKTTFVYQGVITRIRQLDRILDLLSQTPNASLLLIGGGEEEYIDELRNHLRKSAFEHVLFLGKVAPIVLYSLLKHCDLGIISYSMNDYNNKFCAPNKIYEYASLQLPMVTTNQQLFKEVFKEYKIGITVSDTQCGTNKLQTDISIFVSVSLKAADFGKFLDNNNYDKEIKKLSLLVTTKYQSNASC